MHIKIESAIWSELHLRPFYIMALMQFKPISATMTTDWCWCCNTTASLRAGQGKIDTRNREWKHLKKLAKYYDILQFIIISS